jgi:hypothetical protein
MSLLMLAGVAVRASVPTTDAVVAWVAGVTVVVAGEGAEGVRLLALASGRGVVAAGAGMYGDCGAGMDAARRAPGVRTGVGREKPSASIAGCTSGECWTSGERGADVCCY